MDLGSTRDNAYYERAFWLFLFAAATIRLIFLFASPLDLSPDEAYYWDWSRHLSVGYYSKPPMVAWIIWVSTHLFGSSAVAVRLPAVIFGQLTILALYYFSRVIAGQKIALYTCILFGFTILGCVISYVMTIDAPLLFFWTISLYFFWKAIEIKVRAWPWIATGLSVGLGLLSKQTMLAFPAFGFLYLFTEKRTRRLFLTPWPYLALAIALALLLPTIKWNMDHGWITLLHTEHHFEPNKGGAIKSIVTFSRFFFGTLGVMTPITFLLILWVSLVSAKGLFNLSSRERYLFFFGPLPIIMIFFLAFRQKVNVNWPAPFYISAIALTAVWGLQKTPKTLRAAILVGGVITLFAYILPLFMDKLPLSGTRLDPFYRLKGWKPLGIQVGKTMKAPGLPLDSVYVMAYPRQIVSELAFYIPGQPRVYIGKRSREIKSQYDLWESPWDTGTGWNAILVIPEDKRIKKGQFQGLESLKPIKEIEIPVGKSGTKRFLVFLGLNTR